MMESVPGSAAPAFRSKEKTVFLSYAGEDRLVVEEMARRLRQQGIEPWLDRWNLIPGEPFQPAIEEAILHCQACLVLIGSAELGPWQNEEMRLAIQRRVESRGESPFRVIPVLLPQAERPPRSAIPGFLQGCTWIEFRGSLEDPGALHRLVCGILGREPGDLEGGERGAYAGESPYRGLKAFEEGQKDFFFGREVLVEWLVAALRPERGSGRERRFLAITGPSGSGKSSVVRAGLIPQVRAGALAAKGGQAVALLRPGGDPLESLAVALAHAGVLERSTRALRQFIDQARSSERELHLAARLALGSDPVAARRLLLVVDQFEECFTQAGKEVRSAFVDNLLYAATLAQGPLGVVLVIRTDFLGRCADDPVLATAISDHAQLVGPLSVAELREAIERPAALCGHVFEAGLVDLLVDEVADRPGALPFLQHALFELWDRRSQGQLTHEAYLAIGRLEGALSRHASATYQRLSEPGKQICKRILLRLVQPGDRGSDTRRRVLLEELSSLSEPGMVAATVEQLTAADARLLVCEAEMDAAGRSRETVDLAHEALIESWPELRKWLEEDRAGRELQRRLGEAAELWQSGGRRADDLYRGSSLSSALRLGAEQLSLPEREFLLQSFAANGPTPPEWALGAEHRQLVSSSADSFLSTPVPALRQQGIRLLECLPLGQAQGRLVGLVGEDPSPGVRGEAAEALVRRGGAPALVASARGGPRGASARAVTALAELRNDPRHAEEVASHLPSLSWPAFKACRIFFASHWKEAVAAGFLAFAGAFFVSSLLALVGPFQIAANFLFAYVVGIAAAAGFPLRAFRELGGTPLKFRYWLLLGTVASIVLLLLPMGLVARQAEPQPADVARDTPLMAIFLAFGPGTTLAIALLARRLGRANVRQALLTASASTGAALLPLVLLLAGNIVNGTPAAQAAQALSAGFLLAIPILAAGLGGFAGAHLATLLGRRAEKKRLQETAARVEEQPAAVPESWTAAAASPPQTSPEAPPGRFARPFDLALVALLAILAALSAADWVFDRVQLPEFGVAAGDWARLGRDLLARGDYPEGRRRFQDGCAAGELAACAELGELHRGGAGGVEQDPQRAVREFRRACDGGEPKGCAYLGFAYVAALGDLEPDTARAEQLFRDACDRQSLLGCVGLANLSFLNATEDPATAKSAEELYRRACEGGERRGCVGLGLGHLRGRLGLAKDEIAAVRIFKQACDEGEPRGCFNLGKAFELGQGRLFGTKWSAARYYRQACDAGVSNGCESLAQIYAGAGVYFLKDEPLAAALYRKACEGGAAASCSRLALAHQAGQASLEPSTDLVAAYFRKACKGGDLVGCNELGVFLLDHPEMAKDPEAEAFVLFQIACGRGFAVACGNVGVFHYKGQAGLEKNDGLAVSFFRKACDGGAAGGCLSLGTAFTKGEGGLAVDPAAAVKLFRKACEGGSPVGCNNLGLAYEKGDAGLAADRDQALELYKKACRGGVCDDLRRLEGQTR